MATLEDKAETEKKVHPWRLCPAGFHWVREHSMQVPSSKLHPEGYITTRHAHCARNPSGKDILFPDEILQISEQIFKNIEPRPCSINLGRQNGDKYDDLIAGWTKYWNDVLSPKELLDPNIVKALIASESDFNPTVLAKPKDPLSGRGLMQILNDSRKILADEKGDLKNHLVSASLDDLNVPSVNICAGIRWLFEKQRLASSKIKRNASWEETIYNFKGASKASPERATKLLQREQQSFSRESNKAYV
jgi:hypothetical protein